MDCRLRNFIVAATFFLTTNVVVADQHLDKQVGHVMPPDGRGCTFFTLNGVAVADSNYSATSWFAVPLSREGYKEVYVLLLSARLSHETVNVVTTGNGACGHAEISSIYLSAT